MFYGCLGFIDGTLIKNSDPVTSTSLTNAGFILAVYKIYAFNNTIVVDHDGLIIYLDPGYPGCYHDITILRQSDLFHNWRDYFQHDDDAFEYVMGDRK